MVLEGEFSQQDICDIWSYPKQTVHSIILNMNKKGYIYLDTIPKTKNRKIIRLTKLGKQHGAQVINEIRNIELNTIAQLSVEERNQCIYLLEKYVTILKGEMNKYESKSNIKL